MKPSFFIHVRNLVYQFLYGMDIFFRRRAKIIILCYHSVESDNWKYSIGKAEFVRQMSYLSTRYHFISLHQLYQYLTGEQDITHPSVVITFDDGYKNILGVCSTVKKMGIQPGVFVLASPQYTDFQEVGKRIEFLSRKDIKRLKENGWTIGCHSATHPDFWRLSHEEIQSEVKEAKRILENTLNHKINYFAYPRGRYSKQILSAVADSRYLLGLSMDDGNITPNSDKLRIPRIGIDKTHSFAQFKATISPSVILFRQLLKMTPLFRFI